MIKKIEVTLFTVQVCAQLFWGIWCFLFSPHNIFLSILGAALLVYSFISRATDDLDAFLTWIYLASWVIPGTYLIFGALADYGEVLKSAGVDPSIVMLQGTSEDYRVALNNYLISQFIPLTFASLRWFARLFDR